MEQVKQFIYLGASFNEKGDTIKEVKRRIAIAKRASGDLHRIWRNRELPIPLKRKHCSINDWADNELRFRDSTEHDKSL